LLRLAVLPLGARHERPRIPTAIVPDVCRGNTPCATAWLFRNASSWSVPHPSFCAATAFAFAKIPIPEPSTADGPVPPPVTYPLADRRGHPLKQAKTVTCQVRHVDSPSATMAYEQYYAVQWRDAHVCPSFSLPLWLCLLLNLKIHLP
jgi:hypothetical protein